jgi:hypothetical protein
VRVRGTVHARPTAARSGVGGTGSATAHVRREQWLRRRAPRRRFAGATSAARDVARRPPARPLARLKGEQWRSGARLRRSKVRGGSTSVDVPERDIGTGDRSHRDRPHRDRPHLAGQLKESLTGAQRSDHGGPPVTSASRACCDVGPGRHAGGVRSGARSTPDRRRLDPASAGPGAPLLTFDESSGFAEERRGDGSQARRRRRKTSRGGHPRGHCSPQRRAVALRGTTSSVEGPGRDFVGRRSGARHRHRGPLASGPPASGPLASCGPTQRVADGRAAKRPRKGRFAASASRACCDVGPGRHAGGVRSGARSTPDRRAARSGVGGTGSATAHVRREQWLRRRAPRRRFAGPTSAAQDVARRPPARPLLASKASSGAPGHDLVGRGSGARLRRPTFRSATSVGPRIGTAGPAPGPPASGPLASCGPTQRVVDGRAAKRPRRAARHVRFARVLRRRSGSARRRRAVRGTVHARPTGGSIRRRRDRERHCSRSTRAAASPESAAATVRRRDVGGAGRRAAATREATARLGGRAVALRGTTSSVEGPGRGCVGPRSGGCDIGTATAAAHVRREQRLRRRAPRRRFAGATSAPGPLASCGPTQRVVDGRAAKRPRKAACRVRFARVFRRRSGLARQRRAVRGTVHARPTGGSVRRRRDRERHCSRSTRAVASPESAAATVRRRDVGGAGRRAAATREATARLEAEQWRSGARLRRSKVRGATSSADVPERDIGTGTARIGTARIGTARILRANSKSR